nr:copia protein [Tanacetum cinerariifolium]
MAAVKVQQTLEYRSGQLNAAPVLKVENFTNWKNRFMGHIIAKSTWDDLILYHEGPSDMKEGRVMDLKLCYNTFKFKEDSLDDEEDTRSSHEYLNDLEEEYQAFRALLAKYKRLFEKEEVSLDDNEMVKVKVLMALAKENAAVSKEGAKNGEWVKICMRKIISLEREINLRNPQHTFKRCEVCGSSTYTTTDHYDIKWFKRCKALQAKKAQALKSTRAKSSNANKSMTPTKRQCSRHMTGVKSYLHKYVEQSGPEVVFGDESTCTTKGYGSIKFNEESIDSGFARFNTIITSHKTLDEGFSSKNYVRNFLRALHPKWREIVTTIKESKDLSSLSLDELIDNLKIHKVVMEKDSKIYKGKKERVKSISLKAKKESRYDETSTPKSDDEEYTMAVRNFKKFLRRKGKFARQPREENKSFRQRDVKKGKSDRKCFRCGDPNHLIDDCPKSSRNKDQKPFIGGSWSDSKNNAEDKTKDETCLIAQSSNEEYLRTCLEPDEWIKDSGCSQHMAGNKSLFSTYKTYDDGMVDNTLFTKKSKSYLIIVQIYVDDIIFGSTSQNLCDDFAKIMHDEFEMSMMEELNFFLGLQIKQIEDDIFFNQSKYIKEMLKKFSLEDSKPTKTSMSTEIKLTKDDEADFVDSSKYRGTRIETIIYADFDHAGDYVDRKSTRGICTFMECCLTSWFAKTQKALAISTTEAEYVSAEKACQQALWMKQALIDYDIRLDDVLIMCDNKGAIDLSKNPVQHSRSKHMEIHHHFLRDNI